MENNLSKILSKNILYILKSNNKGIFSNIPCLDISTLDYSSLSGYKEILKYSNNTFKTEDNLCLLIGDYSDKFISFLIDNDIITINL